MTQYLPSEHDHPGQATRRKTPEEIAAEISQTRSAISEDIKALGDRLSPENLKQGAKEVLRDAKEEATDMLRTAKDHAIESVTETMSELGDRARRAGHVTTDFVSANAVPLTLIGIGAGWLMMTMRHQRSTSGDRIFRSGWQERGEDWPEDFDYAESRTHQLAEKAREGAGELRERTVELRDRTTEKLSAVRERVKEKASDLGHRAGELSHQARERLDAAQHRSRDFARENPVAVGALAVAAGVGVGLLLPMTRSENRLMGPARDRLLGEARQTAERVGRTAREAVGDLREAIVEPSAR